MPQLRIASVALLSLGVLTITSSTWAGTEVVRSAAEAYVKSLVSGDLNAYWQLDEDYLGALEDARDPVPKQEWPRVEAETRKEFTKFISGTRAQAAVSHLPEAWFLPGSTWQVLDTRDDRYFDRRRTTGTTGRWSCWIRVTYSPQSRPLMGSDRPDTESHVLSAVVRLFLWGTGFHLENMVVDGCEITEVKTESVAKAVGELDRAWAEKTALAMVPEPAPITIGINNHPRWSTPDSFEKDKRILDGLGFRGLWSDYGTLVLAPYCWIAVKNGSYEGDPSSRQTSYVLSGVQVEKRLAGLNRVSKDAYEAVVEVRRAAVGPIYSFYSTYWDLTNDLRSEQRGVKPLPDQAVAGATSAPRSSWPAPHYCDAGKEIPVIVPAPDSLAAKFLALWIVRFSWDWSKNTWVARESAGRPPEAREAQAAMAHAATHVEGSLAGCSNYAELPCDALYEELEFMPEEWIRENRQSNMSPHSLAAAKTVELLESCVRKGLELGTPLCRRLANQMFWQLLWAFGGAQTDVESIASFYSKGRDLRQDLVSMLGKQRLESNDDRAARLLECIISRFPEIGSASKSPPIVAPATLEHPRAEMSAPMVLGVSIAPPEPYSWGMTSQAAKGKLKLREVTERNARYYGLPAGLLYLFAPRTVAGESGDVTLAFDKGTGLLMVEFHPSMRVDENHFRKPLQKIFVADAGRISSFWSEVTAGLTAKYGSPLEVGRPGLLKPGQESKTIWRDGTGNEIWLSLRREPQFAHYQLRLRYVSKEGLARLVDASGL